MVSTLESHCMGDSDQLSRPASASASCRRRHAEQDATATVMTKFRLPVMFTLLALYITPSVSYNLPGTFLNLRRARAHATPVVRSVIGLRSQVGDSQDKAKIAKKDQLQFGTTHVHTDGGSMVEVGCINAKREFIVDAHLLGNLPEHLEPDAKIGSVALVGAGPGDPDLLTVAAFKALQNADLVVSDRLVSAEILALVKGELKVARKLPGCAHEAQREIFRWCVEGLLDGKNVVRLKIGDPYVFGRGGEEMLEFRRLGFEPDVIPGISSALAGPLAAGIPVTHRGVANRVIFMTGNGKDDSIPELAPYHPQQTSVFLMAVGRLRDLAADMTSKGYPTDTPVGIIERATTPRERTVRATLEDIANVAEEQNVQAPAIIVVGEVVNVLAEKPEASLPPSVASLPRQLIEELLQSRQG